ncbi:uncharacterized protein PAN0_001c0646 [Moesziomyces antarcticus]|uniref:Uncharacterized protein n=1 Tax=Pseudozyma antarctica TaxID=84753 RepID=A0A5C3FH04_PSEA2|nr:uncharacterized protein PAN0_001c0646 [Moesziomyces antarcticus]GAK62446.1 hypothetical protein PAN0_001c0646 [Moesziomyces antarcticus]SPO42997.1 uncharacterized protein PSANT_00681 [Moesziomyces antarcticus]
MSLRPDSVYRVDLGERPSSAPADDKSKDDGPSSPPKVLQIRLTEQALQQLASAYTVSGSAKPQIRLNFDTAEPELLVGSVSIPLHASVPAATPQSRPPTHGFSSASPSAAPHELYRLSHDESTLTRVGTIAAKLSVKPTRDVSAVAQRLKQQKEEEELRKEQRRQALIQGSSPNLSVASSSSRSSANKTLAAARASSGSAFFSSSPLSRSSSLTNVTAQRRQPGLLPPAAVSRAQSREVSPGARSSLLTAAHPKVQGASYESGLSTSRSARAITDSPQTSSVAQMRSSTATHSSSHRSSGTGGSSLSTQEEGHVSDDGQSRRADLTSSPASVSSDVAGGAAKKTSKLTTRQRLAKATKAGSRLLAMSERKPTPELRAAPSTTPLAGTSASVNSGTQPSAQNSRSTAIDPIQSTVPKSEPMQKASKPKESVVSASATKTGSDRQEAARLDRSQTATYPDKSKEIASSSRSRAEVAQKTETSTRRTALQESAQQPPKRERTTSIEQNSISFKTERPGATITTAKAGAASSRSPEKVARAAVPVVTMRRARPPAVDDPKSGSPRATSQSGPTAKAAAPAIESDRSEREQRPRARSDSRTHIEISNSAGPSSSPPSKLANTKKRVDESSDAAQRKRRRTNDFAPPSDQPTRYRERRLSASPEPISRRADNDMPRRRDESAMRPVRPTEASTSATSIREHVPPSASMPSFASVGHRLRSVPETSERESRNAKVDDYRGRRRDRGSDEQDRGTDATRDRGKSYYREAEEGSRGRSGAPDAHGSSSRGPSNGSSAVKSPSGSGERSIKGVGPGAAHWSEPWLDVRSRSDWHRLAQRFAKTQQEYLASRKRLEAESERLDRELELASAEEQAASQPIGLHSQASANQSLLFSPHAHPVSKMTRHGSTGESDELDVDMLDVEKETSVNTAHNAAGPRRRESLESRRREPREDGEESPEEGEMRSSDDEAGQARAKKGSNSAEGGARAAGAEFETLLRQASRSESPDNIAWRAQPTGVAAAADGSDGDERARSRAVASDRPLSYADLADRVHQLAELHGSLSRMHRVLVDFKAKRLADTLA